MFEETKGKLLESYSNVKIYDGFPFYFYEVSDPLLSEDEKKIKSLVSDLLLGKISIENAMPYDGAPYTKDFIYEFRDKVLEPVSFNQLRDGLLPKEEFASLKSTFVDIMAKHLRFVRNRSVIADLCLSECLGYGVLEPLVLDEALEEIMVNGYDKNIFVFHRKYGHCKTNIVFPNRRDLDFLLQKIARSVGKNFDADSPLLDARLPDGNRANATYYFVTPKGPSLTIRKFTSSPLSIVDLVINGTFSSEVAGFLWLAVEGWNSDPMNIIVTGGSGSGKTTTMNALANFIRYQERIISIEDTLEIQLGKRDNWVQMETRPAIKGQEGVTMDDLLKNALRMRPDRLILGEVRGPEAETLFIAMDTGHRGCLGTLHSNSAKELMLRLKSPPMNVPESLLPLLNLVLVQYKIYIKNVGVHRRVYSVSEVTSMDQKPLLANIFEWDKATDSIKRTSVPSSIIERIANRTLKSKKEVENEILIRKKIIEWMIRSGIRSQSDVQLVIQQYYYDSQALLERVFDDKSAYSGPV